MNFQNETINLVNYIYVNQTVICWALCIVKLIQGWVSYNLLRKTFSGQASLTMTTFSIGVEILLVFIFPAIMMVRTFMNGLLACVGYLMAIPAYMLCDFHEEDEDYILEFEEE